MDADSEPLLSQAGDPQLDSLWPLFTVSDTLQFPFDTGSPRRVSRLVPAPPDAAFQPATDGPTALLFSPNSAMVTLLGFLVLLKAAGLPMQQSCTQIQTCHSVKTAIGDRAPGAVETSLSLSLSLSHSLSLALSLSRSLSLSLSLSRSFFLLHTHTHTHTHAEGGDRKGRQQRPTHLPDLCRQYIIPSTAGCAFAFRRFRCYGDSLLCHSHRPHLNPPPHYTTELYRP